jgi:HEAT repeat protein
VIGKVGAGAFRDYDHLSPSGHVLVADTLRTSGLLVLGDSDPRVLREALGRASDAGSRSALRWLVGGRAALDAAGLEAFEQRLADDDASVRQAAAWGLASAGAAAASKASVLGDALAHDQQPGVRMACARALGAIGSRLGVPALLEALADPSESVRAAAAQALFRIGPAPEDVQSLTAVLASPDRYVAAFAAWSLGNLGAAAESAVPELVKALARDETNAVVAGALARIGPAAAAAVPELVRALGSEDDGRRFRAARTLGRIGPPAAAAVEPLTAALRDSNSVVRAHAARALGRIGPAAKPAAAALQRATGDRDSGVREEAQKALARLQGAPE